MRLYGVLTTLCVAVFALILDVQPANADAGASNSPLLAQQKSKLSTSANSTLLAQVNTSPIILTKSEKKTEESKEKNEAKNNVAEKLDQSAEKPQTIVTVQAGDSLASIAEKYEVSWTRLFDANESIANPDVINPGDNIRIPEADEELPDRSSQIVAAQQAAVQSAVAATTTRSYTTAPVNSSSYYVGNGMWCTDYVHSRRPDVAIYGNAGYNWISSAAAAGKSTGSTPQAGAVAVTNGHVAYVESVNADGSYVVSEMGWNYQAGNYNQRTVKPGTFGQFIY